MDACSSWSLYIQVSYPAQQALGLECTWLRAQEPQGLGLKEQLTAPWMPAAANIYTSKSA